jgi:hypothetical protein
MSIDAVALSVEASLASLLYNSGVKSLTPALSDQGFFDISEDGGVKKLMLLQGTGEKRNGNISIQYQAILNDNVIIPNCTRNVQLLVGRGMQNNWSWSAIPM